MKMERISSPIPNTLLQQYWGNEPWVSSFFPYVITEAAFQNRLTWLNGQAYERDTLVQVIRSYMTPYGVSPKAEQHLTNLKNDAVVVVGGQQTGLLTGPLFSIYKAITVILLAKQQSEILQQPVVPLFWIAGEDHDLDEINHTYTMQEGRVQKQIFGASSRIKQMASYTKFDRTQLRHYVQQVFKDYGETAYTASLLARVLAPIETTETYTEYFTALLHELFAHEGLLLVDAAYEPFRQMESQYFVNIIERNEQIATAVVEQEQAFITQGFAAPLQAVVENANLFYVDNGERFLLERKDEYFVNTLKGLRFTKEELLQIAKQQPARLSNNVVTRPLMQEMVMPVLAFVGGPGELAYWATLKTAFEAIDLQMPIFVPRLSMTLIGRQAQYAMEQSGVTYEQVFTGQVPQLKEQFIASQKSEQVLEAISTMEQQLQKQYESLEQILQEQQIALTPTLQRNESYHQQQFEYLKRKLHEQYEVKHAVMLRHMNIAQAQLLPNDKPQERLYSIYQFMNEVGPQLVEQLLEQVNAIESEHLLVQL